MGLGGGDGGGDVSSGGGVSTGGGKSANDDSDSDANAAAAADDDAVDKDDADVRGIDGIGGGAIDDDDDNDDDDDDDGGVVDFLISVSPVFRRIPLLTDGSDKTLIAIDDGAELCISSILTLGVALSGTVDNEKTDDVFDGVDRFDDSCVTLGVALGVSLLLDFSFIFMGVTGTSGDGILTLDKLEDDDAISLNWSLLGLTDDDIVDGADETSENEDKPRLRDGFELDARGEGAGETLDNTSGVEIFFGDDEEFDVLIDGGSNDASSIFNSSSESGSGCCFFNLTENLFFVGSDGG
jgi:hypothetical protein